MICVIAPHTHSLLYFHITGQLEFINAGWCMSDEAAPFYVDMVDQETLGHQFLLKEIGPEAVIRTGWQVLSRKAIDERL